MSCRMKFVQELIDKIFMFVDYHHAKYFPEYVSKRVIDHLRREKWRRQLGNQFDLYMQRVNVPFKAYDDHWIWHRSLQSESG